jgi:hypothetical protein
MSVRLEPGPVAPEAADGAVQRALESRPFQKSQTLRTLLAWLWAHRDKEISEYAVGTGALGRRADFDPKNDAAARVQISRLRQKLKDYYETEAAGELVRIVIPLGGHRLELQPFDALAEAEPLPESPPFARPMWLWLAVTVVCVIAVALWLGRATSGEKRAIPALPDFWQTFLANRKPVRLVVCTPAFVRWPETPLIGRDINIHEFSGAARSPFLADLTRRHGSPRLSESFVRKIDMFAVSALAQFLSERGVAVALEDDNIALDAIQDHNLIVLGSPGGVLRLEAAHGFSRFGPLPNGEGFSNPKALPGEPDRFEQARISPRRKMVPGVILMTPPAAGCNRLYLMGEHTAGLVALLTIDSGLRSLEQSRRAAGSPAYFEWLLQQEMDGYSFLRATPLHLRALERGN